MSRQAVAIAEDAQQWHAATSTSVDPIKNDCRGFLEIFDGSSLPGVGQHSPAELIQGGSP